MQFRSLTEAIDTSTSDGQFGPEVLVGLPLSGGDARTSGLGED